MAKNETSIFALNPAIVMPFPLLMLCEKIECPHPLFYRLPELIGEKPPHLVWLKKLPWAIVTTCCEVQRASRVLNVPRIL